RARPRKPGGLRGPCSGRRAQIHLGRFLGAGRREMSDAADPAAIATATLNICNQRGLHARASAKFVKLASEFESEIHVTRDGVSVDARSIMGLLMLGAGIGCDVEVKAEGRDAPQAVAALTDLVARRFDEDQ